MKARSVARLPITLRTGTRFDMQDLGRWLIYGGLALALAGCIVVLLARTGFRGLPGDIRFESDRVRVYFPIATCIVLSILLTAVSWIWRRFSRK